MNTTRLPLTGEQVKLLPERKRTLDQEQEMLEFLEKNLPPNVFDKLRKRYNDSSTKEVCGDCASSIGVRPQGSAPAAIK